MLLIVTNYDWEKAFNNVEVNKKELIFNESVINIIRNFIPHETVTFDDRYRPWINSRTKKAINDKSQAFKRLVNKRFVKSNSNLERFSSLQKNLRSLI